MLLASLPPPRCRSSYPDDRRTKPHRRISFFGVLGNDTNLAGFRSGGSWRVGESNYTWLGFRSIFNNSSREATGVEHIVGLVIPSLVPMKGGFQKPGLIIINATIQNTTFFVLVIPNKLIQLIVFSGDLCRGIFSRIPWLSVVCGSSVTNTPLCIFELLFYKRRLLSEEGPLSALKIHQNKLSRSR